MKLPLWPHQKDAIREILRYLESSPSKGFLVKMPTGTGKTAVFCMLSRILLEEKNFLILVPSKALRDQILGEIKTNLWPKLKYKQTLPEKEILPVFPSEVGNVITKFEKGPFIGVMTIHTLQNIYSTKHTAYAKLKSMVDIIVFDEGHREPAYSWSESVRNMEKPTILFSATPYRNDFKIFNIDKQQYYFLGHEQSVKGNILRNVAFQKLSYARKNSVKQFCEALINEFRKRRPALLSSGIAHPKVVVRCATEATVNSITQQLHLLRQKVVGVHENFSGKGIYRNHVPTLEEQNNYDFFVHQFKMVEGIDNPEFCVLAMFEDFGNTRSLIQQIGRVLRNVKEIPGQTAIVYHHTPQVLVEQWEKYIDFDKLVEKKKRLHDISDVISVNPDIHSLYFNGHFRDIADLKTLDLTKSLRFNLRTNIFQVHKPATIDELAAAIIEEWEKRDFEIIQHKFPQANCFLLLYISYESSPLIEDALFVEQNLGYTFCKLSGDLVFYHDSQGNMVPGLSAFLQTLPYDKLVKTFSNKIKFTTTTLLNADLGNNALRSREISANTLETSGVTLGDHMYFPTSFTGYIHSTFTMGSQRRYLGVKKARVADFISERFEFSKYLAWLQTVENTSRSTISSASLENFLGRYAVREPSPSITTPVSILLDLDDEVRDNYQVDGLYIEYDNLYSDVAGGQFQLYFNSQAFDVSISYDILTKRYRIESSSLDSGVISKSDNFPPFTQYLNLNQCFRVLMEGNRYIYAYGVFIAPSLNLIGKQKNLDLLQIFHRYPAIRSIKSEKGDQKGAAKLPTDGHLWHADSLFGLLARQGAGYGNVKLEREFNFDHLVCDDLQNPELADFIGLNMTKRRIVFIHAKAGDADLSASAFSEVCGQATKNLDYLNPFFSKNPAANIKKWAKPWSIAKLGKADRLTTCTPLQFWNNYRQLISHPATIREVWLVVGNLFDLDKFKKEIDKTKISQISPQAFQLIYLLRSTWGAVQSVGAVLKIFC